MEPGGGKEQKWFSKYIGCEVIGTEISDTAKSFANTIQWDFHEVKKEWLGNVDFIYSNSLDHSYNPEKCLNAWMSCLKKDGACIIEFSSSNEKAIEMDPFATHISYLPYLILNWGKGKFNVKEILDTPIRKEGLEYNCFLIVQKR